MSHTDDTEEFVDLSEPERATAYFAKSIALLMFALIAGSIGAGVSAASRAEWAVIAGGIASLVLIVLALNNFSDGNRLLKR